MTRALVLDFGGVVTQTLFETHAQSEAALGLPPGSLTWRGPFDPERDDLWRAMQDERISERDYWLTRSREVGQRLGEVWNDMATLVRRTRGGGAATPLRPEAVAAVSAARAAGCKLAILSNELDLFYGADCRTRIPLLAQFDVIEDATYSGILKPDARAYARCVARLGLPAEACVFVDDQLRNVIGARQAGLQGIHLDVRRPADGFAQALSQVGLSR